MREEMLNLQRALERDLVWQWARAESGSARFGKFYLGLDFELLEHLKGDEPGLLNYHQWRALENVVFGSRSPLLSGLKRLGTDWYLGSLTVRELHDLKIMNWPDFVALAPSRKLTELAKALDAGAVPKNDMTFSQAYHAVRKAFSREKIRGFPVLVSEIQQGPYTIVEGYTRLAVLASLFPSQGEHQFELNVIVGVCPKLREWYLHDNQSSLCLF